MIIQEQRWHDRTIILFVDEYGSAQLELFDKPQLGDLQCTAFVFNLWTNPEHRCQGHATNMIAAIERAAAKHGHSAVFLDYELAESPREILEWYLRNGYRVVGFNDNGDFNRLKKQLKPERQ